MDSGGVGKVIFLHCFESAKGLGAINSYQYIICNCHHKISSEAGGGAEVIINEAKKERRYYLKGIKNNLFN